MARALSQRDIECFRERACASAERLFAEHGFGGVTLRSLAAEMGCSPMTPYRYFSSKQEIFDAVRTAAFRRFGLRIEAAMDGIADPVERLRAAARAYVGFARDEPHAYRIMFQLDQGGGPADVDDPEQVRELKRGWNALHAAICDAVAEGRLRGDPVDLAHIAWVMLHGLVTLHLADKLRMERDLDALLEPLLDHFLRSSDARPPLERDVA